MSPLLHCNVSQISSVLGWGNCLMREWNSHSSIQFKTCSFFTWWYQIVLSVPRFCEGSTRNHCAECTTVPYRAVVICWGSFMIKTMGWGLKCWDSDGIRTCLLQTAYIHVYMFNHTYARKPQSTKTQICQAFYVIMSFIMPSSLHSHETFEFINLLFQ